MHIQEAKNYLKEPAAKRFFSWLGIGTLALIGIIVGGALVLLGIKSYLGSPTSKKQDVMVNVSAPLPMCADATTVELGPYPEEATIVVREECMSSLIVRKDPKRFLDLKHPGQGNVDIYIFRDGRYVAPFSHPQERDTVLNLDTDHESIRLAGYNGTVTARLR